MKNIIMIVVLTMACNACFAQENENNLSKLHLKGPVKQVTIHYFEDIKKIDTSNSYHKNILRFDTTGNEIEEISYDTSRIHKILTTVFTYDEKNDNIDIIESDPDTTLFIESILKYNNKGYLAEKEEIWAQDTVFRSTYKYDDKGRQVEMDIFGKRDKPEDTTTKAFMKYDEKGNEIERDVYISSFGLFGKRIYKYNIYSLEIYNVWYNGAGRLSDEIKSEYSDFDTRGNWTMKSVTEDVPGDPTKKTIVKRVIIYY